MVIRGSQVPVGCTPGGGDDADPMREQAVEVFAEQLTADRVPSIRAIRTQLHVGQARAQRLQDYLAGGAGRPGQGRRITDDELTHRHFVAGRRITCQTRHIHRLLVELAKQSLALGRVHARFRHGRPVDSR
jgi:hypothetical protein